MRLLGVQKFLCALKSLNLAKSTPTWESIDSRPIPRWYQNAKFGIFCHWGVYSVPAYRSEWIWWYWKGSSPDPDVQRYIENNFRHGTTYADFANDLSAEFFDANVFKEIVEASGARYFVLTSKHVEGFTMWPSATSWMWNSVDGGPNRDIVGELSKAFNSSSVHFGVYFSQYEWFNRYYLNDVLHNTTNYPAQVSYPQMMELVNEYKPELIWSDGDWERSDEYWKSKEFIAWLYNDSPVKDTVVVNDRWGAGIMGKHGGFLTYMDHYDPGHLLPRKWESCTTLDKYSWGNRRNMRSGDVSSVSDVINLLVRTIACNGNLLLNVGPTNHGMIPPIFEDRLYEIGRWIRRNSEAIFDTNPWMHQNDTDKIWYLVSLPKGYRMKPHAAWTPHVEGSKLYAFFLEFPRAKTVTLPSVLYEEGISAEVLLDEGQREEIEVMGEHGEPVTLHFDSHQHLAAYGKIVVAFEHFSAKYRDPIRYLKKMGILDSDGHPTRMGQFTKT
ncbi:unnamed protein product [Toxocara canis]|uniref:Putative alpha-L-fucosidase n=1 Tax=Toxocara canis TaxID=6265 RepID=A0A183TUV7_TOXCA|nr:unnamed protein product [Toxocara canis]